MLPLPEDAPPPPTHFYPEDLNQEFRSAVAKKHHRLRYALLGDAILRVEAVKYGLKRWPSGNAGKITTEISVPQENKWMEFWMRRNGIQLPYGDTEMCKKAYGDSFEAWIGFLHERNEQAAINFCQAYLRDCLDRKSVSFAEFTTQFR